MAACLIALATLFFGGCGLEEYVVLEPPVNQSSGAQILFLHNQENQTNFNGYMVVYRLYENSDKAQAAASSIEASWTSLTPDVLVKNRLSKFVSLVVLDAADDSLLDSPPTIQITDPTDKVEVSLPLTESGDGAIYTNDTPFTVRVRRNAKDGEAFRTFLDLAFDESDCDYETDRSSAWVLAYGYAYGFELNSSSFKEIYSQPLRLLLEKVGAP